MYRPSKKTPELRIRWKTADGSYTSANADQERWLRKQKIIQARTDADQHGKASGAIDNGSGVAANIADGSGLRPSTSEHQRTVRPDPPEGMYIRTSGGDVGNTDGGVGPGSWAFKARLTLCPLPPPSPTSSAPKTSAPFRKFKRWVDNSRSTNNPSNMANDRQLEMLRRTCVELVDLVERVERLENEEDRHGTRSSGRRRNPAGGVPAADRVLGITRDEPKHAYTRNFNDDVVEKAVDTWFKTLRRQWLQENVRPTPMFIAMLEALQKAAWNRRYRQLHLSRYDVLLAYPTLSHHKGILCRLGVDGMSSDEDDEESKAYLIAKKQWRSAELDQFLHRLDRISELRDRETRGYPLRKREACDRISEALPVKGLPRNCYKRDYLQNMNPWKREQLAITNEDYDFSFPDWVEDALAGVFEDF
ncbi:hypothetical protein FRB99_007495 [Tulasnella sp. 403]|nr:hypothetical protein FRB99_007495 [Tulasnella sp. 403]